MRADVSRLLVFAGKSCPDLPVESPVSQIIYGAVWIYGKAPGLLPTGAAGQSDPHQ